VIEMRLHSFSKNLKWAAGTVLVTGCLVASAGQIAAAPRPTGVTEAGLEPPARVESNLDVKTESAVLTRAGKTRDALGFPVGATRIGRHVRDGIERAEYDEVTELDAAGKVQAITQFDSGGQLRAAVRLDPVPVTRTKIGREGAVSSARQSVAKAGLAVATPTSTEVDVATGGWTVHWARMKAGVRVRGDETRVGVWPDGRIQSVSIAEHELAAAPARRIGSGEARQVASANLTSWFTGKSSGYVIQRVQLEWVGPNAAFDPSRIGASDAPYRLAWVTDVKPSGDAANYVRMISLFVDAADGTIIGGDIVE